MIIVVYVDSIVKKEGQHLLYKVNIFLMLV